MNRGHILTAAIAVVVVASGLGVAVTTVSAQSQMEISSVNVTPADPITGETVTVETTITNPQTANGTGDITAIYLRRAGGDLHEYGRVSNVGSVEPGGETTIRMPITFETAGEKRIVVNVGVEDADGNHQTYQYPVYVDVEEPDVRADITTNTSGDSTTVTLTNYGNVNFTDVNVTASVDGTDLARQYAHDVAPGASRSVRFDTSDVGNENVTFTATYTAADTRRTTSHTAELARAVQGEIDLTGLQASQSGDVVTIQGEAANIGSTETGAVMVTVGESTAASPVAPSGEYFIGSIEASSFATFELTATAAANTTSIPVEVSYNVDGERRTTTHQVDLASALGGDGQRGAAGAGEETTGDTDAEGGGLPLIGGGVVLVGLLVGAAGVRLYRRQDR